MHLFCHCIIEYQIIVSVSITISCPAGKTLDMQAQNKFHVNDSYQIIGKLSVVYLYGGTKDFPFNLACNMLLRCDVVTAFPNGLYLSQTSAEIQIIAFYVDGCILVLENLHTRKQSSRWKEEHLALYRASEEVT